MTLQSWTTSIFFIFPTRVHVACVRASLSLPLCLCVWFCVKRTEYPRFRPDILLNWVYCCLNRARSHLVLPRPRKMFGFGEANFMPPQYLFEGSPAPLAPYLRFLRHLVHSWPFAPLSHLLIPFFFFLVFFFSVVCFGSRHIACLNVGIRIFNISKTTIYKDTSF